MECLSRICRAIAACAVWIVAAAAILGLTAGGFGLTRALAATQGTPPASPTARPDIEQGEPEELSFFQWMEKARAGDVEAQCNVGVFYVNGQGVPRDYQEGIGWLYRSGNMGYAHAQYLLATLYSQGFGETTSDPFRSWFWAALASANQTLPENERGRSLKMMSAAESALSAQHLAGAQKMAKDWWEGRAAAPR